VYWDRQIEAGSEWNEEIQRELSDSRCVLVLWSLASKTSFWVTAEAARSFEKDTYLPLRIDRTEPPRLFRHIQALSIANWIERKDDEEISRPKAMLRSRIGTLPMYGNLEQVADNKPVRDVHLHLLSSRQAERHCPRCHGRAWPGRPRLFLLPAAKSWMAGLRRP
jgi:hypothetical protein